MKKKQPTKIILFGHFGSGNHGNEATLLAIVSRLRVLLPNCELRCICSFPEHVAPRYGVEAIPHTVRAVRIWDREVPLGRRMRMAVIGLAEEIGEYARIWRTVAGADMFVVPGTGALTDAFGLSGWGPYGVFKWTLMAKLRRCRPMFVSVGAGPVRTGWGRAFLRIAFALADYRSYRDVPSSKAVEGSLFRTRRDEIYPDLVFGLPSPAASKASAGPRSRAVVGIGLMEYAPGYSVANPLGNTYERYLESLAGLVNWLIEQEHDVKLLLGDSDAGVVADLRRVLSDRFGPAVRDRVAYRPTLHVDELLEELSTTDLMVATRFHNILMSLLLDKPVVAVSFHDKCSALMRQMGLSEYVNDMSTIDTDSLIAQFQDLSANADELRELIRRGVEASREALDEQYELLFGGGVSSEERAADAVPAATSSRVAGGDWLSEGMPPAHDAVRRGGATLG